MPKKKPTPTYVAWTGMRQRCNNPKALKYADYGGRGIRVCERWSVYENFLADMGEKPAGMSLDRIDVDGHYEPSNCIWATQKEQMRNMRITRKVTIGGETYVAKDLAEKLGMKTDTIVSRATVCSTLEELMDPNRRVFKEGLALGGLANGERLRSRTHCNYGHEFTEHNSMVGRDGVRRCRECHNAKMRRRTAAKKANMIKVP